MRRRSTSESLATTVLIEVLQFLPHLAFVGLVEGAFSGSRDGFTLSTSDITSLNGSGMCGIGFEFVIFFVVMSTVSHSFLAGAFGSSAFPSLAIGASKFNVLLLARGASIFKLVSPN
jgi:H+/Cl- antiporter ClcA